MEVASVNENLKRFTLELEFVQSLSNPKFLYGELPQTYHNHKHKQRTEKKKKKKR